MTTHHSDYYSKWYVDRLSRDRYGTDVPTLNQDVQVLERKLRHASADLFRREKELKELKHRHQTLQSKYDTVFDMYDHMKEILRNERRYWRRLH